MKRLLTILIIIFCTLAIFAQTTTDETITKTEQSTSDKLEALTQTTVEKGKLYTITINYMQSMDEAYFTYSTNSALFEQSEAMKGIRSSVEKFIKDHGYYFYTYLGADVTKYDNINELALYTSHFKFLTNK
jgi:TfoX/Sxy family transcriptional regulator of competence genes